MDEGTLQTFKKWGKLEEKWVGKKKPWREEKRKEVVVEEREKGW